MIVQTLSKNELKKFPDLMNIKLPLVLKDRILMSPGIWNNFYYDSDTIGNAFENSDWEDKSTRALLWDHKDLEAQSWIGEIKNERMIGKNLVGDLVVVDMKAARSLLYGAKFGISPKVVGDEENQVMSDYTFANFSVVINPAVKTAYINNSEEKKSNFEVVKKCDFKMNENYAYFINANGDICRTIKEINMAEKVKEEEVKEEPEAEEVSEKAETEKLSEVEKGILKAADDIRKKHSLEEIEEKKEEPEKTEETPETPAETKEEPKEVENKDVSILKEIKTIVKSLGDRMEAIEKTVKDLSSEPETTKKEFKMSQTEVAFGMLPSSVSVGDQQMMNFMRQHI